MAFIAVTSEVLRFSNPLISSRLERFKNQLSVVVGRQSLNEVSKTALITFDSGSFHVPAQAGYVL